LTNSVDVNIPGIWWVSPVTHFLFARINKLIYFKKFGLVCLQNRELQKNIDVSRNILARFQGGSVNQVTKLARSRLHCPTVSFTT
jgi:hypothetical protein